MEKKKNKPTRQVRKKIRNRARRKLQADICEEIDKCSLYSKKGHRTNHISKVFAFRFYQSVKCLDESKGESFMVSPKCELKLQHGTRHMSDDLHS